MATTQVKRRDLADLSRRMSASGLVRRSGGETTTGGWSARAIRELRKRMGATQEEFAQILGVAASSVHRWEAGRVSPDRRTCDKMASLVPILRILDKHFRVEGRAQFFKTPQPRLDGDRPMDLLGLPSATKRIESVVKSILAGDFS